MCVNQGIPFVIFVHISNVNVVQVPHSLSTVSFPQWSYSEVHYSKMCYDFNIYCYTTNV